VTNAPTIDIDPSTVLRHLGWPAPASASVVQGGWDTYLWRIVTEDGRAHALRLYRGGEGRDIDAAARREEVAIAALAGAGVPVPAIEASGRYQGAPVFLLSWLPGRPLLDILQTRVWRLWRLGREFGRLHARIHAVPPPAEMRLASSDEWITVTGDPEVESAVRAVAVDDAVCHFDFHPLNVLSDGRRLTGLIDLPSTVVADRRADLGRTRAILLAAPLPPSPIKPLLQLIRSLFSRAWESGYRESAGAFPIHPLFEAWGGATFLNDIHDAVGDGRGWGASRDVTTVRRFVESARRRAGLPALPAPPA
jgi:aminoglycoside phosphotransferase (APT) family kinase protein